MMVSAPGQFGPLLLALLVLVKNLLSRPTFAGNHGAYWACQNAADPRCHRTLQAIYAFSELGELYK